MKTNKKISGIVKNLVQKSFKDQKILESQVVRSIKLLKSLPKNDAIQALSEYLKNLKRKERMHTLFIEASTPLSFLQIKKVKKIIEKKTAIAKIVVKTNPEIIGGFKLRVGDDVWDYSLLGHIEKVKEAIAHGGSGQ